jgi:hypothetical protein
LEAAGVRVPHVYLAQRLDLDGRGSAEGEGCGGPLVPAAAHASAEYLFVMQRLMPRLYLQPAALGLELTLRAVRAAAAFHAAFWRDVSGNGDRGPETRGGAEAPAAFGGLASRLWRRGLWWRQELRPTVRYDRIADAAAGLCAAFPAECGALASPATTAAWQWLERNRGWLTAATEVPPRSAVATAAAAQAAAVLGGRCAAAGTSVPQYVTLVHGDLKTANMFFAARSPTACPCSSAGCQCSSRDGVGDAAVTLIDFQWTGPAPSGAGDLVYLLVGGVQYGVLEAEEAAGSGAAALLDAYHAELTRRLELRGFVCQDAAGGCAYTRAQLGADFQLELLEYAATALPYLLAGLTPAGAAANATKHGWLTHEYDARVIAWLCAAAASVVQRLAAAGIGAKCGEGVDATTAGTS